VFLFQLEVHELFETKSSSSIRLRFLCKEDISFTCLKEGEYPTLVEDH